MEWIIFQLIDHVLLILRQSPIFQVKYYLANLRGHLSKELVLFEQKQIVSKSRFEIKIQ